MAGSAAEERLRATAEQKLRAVFPDARIVHELVLKQGGVRIDLAAVTPDRLICVEIKSERDTLKRLPEQVKAMREVCDAWIVYVAPKHGEAAAKVAGWGRSEVEAAPDHPYTGWGRLQRDSFAGLCNAPARLEMLWAEELKVIAQRNSPRLPCITAATDSMTGSQVRRAVCDALRRRPFPRADPPTATGMDPDMERK